MLTIADIDAVCEAHGDQLSKAIFPGLQAARTLYISEKVRQFITCTAPGMDTRMRERWLTARALLEQFVDGKWITVKSKKKSRAEMGILCPHSDGIWEFRDVKPKPSLRILGGFSEKDVFIALAPHERSELGAKGSNSWNNALRDFNFQWTQLFDGHKRLSGGDLANDYLSNARYLD